MALDIELSDRAAVWSNERLLPIESFRVFGAILSAMTFDEIRQVAAPILERYGVRYAGVFGSVARGENTPDSDVDVLVVLKQPVSLLRFFALNDELETALGCKVDLVTRDSLNPRVRPFALKELQTVYEEVR